MSPASAHARTPRPIQSSPLTLALGAAAGAAALGLLAALPDDADASIVPGRSVAGVALNDSAARVRSVLGAPEAGSTLFNLRYIRRHGLGVYLIAGKVFEITVLRGPQATAAGVKVGTPTARLRAAHRSAVCRPAAIRTTIECRMAARFAGRATETLLVVQRGVVKTISVGFR